MATYRIEDLGEKVAFVVGYCEFRRIRTMLIQADPRRSEPSHKRILNATKQRSIAEYLGISPSQWTRMRKGSEAINDMHLAKLAEYFDVDRYCDFLVWNRPYDIFTATLTTLGYDRLRYRTTGEALRDFLDRRAGSEYDGIRIQIVSTASWTRGIGTVADALPFPSELRPGDRVRIAVRCSPGLSHLVLLSRAPNDEFTVLAPLAPKSASLCVGTELQLPGENDAYPVGRPFGSYLLYAIHTRETLGLEIRLAWTSAFPVLTTIDESALRDAIAGQGDDHLDIRRLPYEVIR